MINIFRVYSFRTLQALKDDIKAGRKSIKGVNLGGWLVAEYWMTSASPAWNGVPSNIANQGEYQTMKHLGSFVLVLFSNYFNNFLVEGHNQGDSQFKQHRDTFITEQDFREIANARMNTVRIPVGYWITGFDNQPGGDPDGWKVYAPGGINYLDRAIREWAPKYGILVIISLHAAKGSQNGNDHSSPQNPGNSYWSGYQENVRNTLDAVEWLARRYSNDLSFLGIGLLNEPAGKTKAKINKG